MRLVLALLSVLIPYRVVAQSLPGEWKTFTSMRNATAVASTRDSLGFWVATDGGAFRTSTANPDASQFIALRNTDGLSNNELTAIASDADGDIFIGGSGGSFDIYSEVTGKVRQERSIMVKPEFTDKTINQLAVFGDRVYIAAAFGLSMYNRKQNYFEETATRFGNLAPDQVRGVIESGGVIYVVLSNGAAFAPANSPQLNAWSTWTSVPAPASQ